MDVKITDLSALMPKSITILDDPDASTITVSAPETKITVSSDQLKVTTSSETMASIGDVNITSLADNQVLAYDSATSKWVNEAQGSAPVTSVNTETGAVVLDTDDISEGSSNLYYTDARARASISASGSLSYNSSTGALTYTQGNTDTVAEGSTNLYFTNARFDSRFDTQLATKSTTNLTEGTNLYYTDARVLTKINATDLDALSDVHTATPSDGQVLAWDNGNSRWAPTTNPTAPVTSVNSLTGAVSLNSGLIPELTNLYYTDTRARASNSVTSLTAGNVSSLTYDSGTGTFTFTPCDASGKTVLTGSTNNQITTVTGAHSIQGESNLTFNGSTLGVTGDITVSGTVDGIDVATRDGVLTTTTTTANAALPKAGGTMSGAIAMGTEKITGMGDPTAAQDAATKTYVDDAVVSGGGAVTGYTNGTDNRIITSSGTTTINGEANFTFDGSNAVLSGSAGGLTSPVLEIETDNSSWNTPQLMFKDSNDDVWSMAGRNQEQTVPFDLDQYQAGFTFDPNNNHGRTGVTTYAGDYFVAFSKDYTDQSAIAMNMVVYGANDGFNISAYDDFNDGGGGQYGLKPIVLNGEQVDLKAGGGVALSALADKVEINQNVEITHGYSIKFEDAGTELTSYSKGGVQAKGAFTVNVDSDNSGNEAFKIQSAGTDVLKFERGPGGDAEMVVSGDGFFIKDDNNKTNFSMDLSSAGNTGINVIRSDENKTLSFTLKTDDDDDTGNYDGSWSFRQNANNKKLILERSDSGTVDIFEVRDSADSATADPVDIFDFKIPVVFPSFAVSALPTTVVAGAQAFCTDETGGAVNVFYDGSNWRRVTDRAIAS